MPFTEIRLTDRILKGTETQIKPLNLLNPHQNKNKQCRKNPGELLPDTQVALITEITSYSASFTRVRILPTEVIFIRETGARELIATVISE